MKKWLSFLLTVCLLFLCAITPVSAASKGVTVTVADFTVRLNGHEVSNVYNKYPLIVYNQITYFPMTYYECRFLGLTTAFTDISTGLFITASGEAGEYNPTMQNMKNASSYSNAQIVTYPVTVNGKAIDNVKEQYPLLLFRDVTYFPLTWRFCVDEFGWDYQYSTESGLTIASKPIEKTTIPTVIPISDFGSQIDEATGRSHTGGNGVTIPDYEETVGNLVWVPVQGGTKYHSNPYCSSMDDPMRVTIETAEANGYTPCKRCYGK